MLDIRADGHGEIAFGAFQASLDLAYGYSDVSFDWAGFDEMDEVRGSGSAELLEDGSLEIEFDRHHGDEAIVKANERLLQQPASEVRRRRRSAPDRLNGQATRRLSAPPSVLTKVGWPALP